MVKIKTLTEVVLDDVRSHFEPHIVNSTVHIIHVSNKQDVQPTASGILLEVYGRKFLVTAAHVFKQNIDEYFIPLNDAEYTSIGGKVVIAKKNKTKHDKHYKTDDSIDVMLCELDEETIDKISPYYDFVPYNKFQLNHILEEKGLYIIIGYPTSKTKVNRTSIEAGYTFISSNGFPKFAYERYGFDTNTSIAVRWDGFIKGLTGNKTQAPNLVGTSGAGLWNIEFSSDLSNLAKFAHLVGIVIERKYEKGNSAIIATRIDVVNEILREKFNVDIPPSQTVKL